jgi:hypothetical protein
MFEIIQIMALLMALLVMLTITSDNFAFAVSRVMEAGFDAIEYRLALRAKSRAERLKSRRREERRRSARVNAEVYS